MLGRSINSIFEFNGNDRLCCMLACAVYAPVADGDEAKVQQDGAGERIRMDRLKKLCGPTTR